MALSVDGEVYSWGEGDDGKLGHGNKTSCDRPRVIEALRGKDICFIACGGAHSAAITATGNCAFSESRYIMRKVIFFLQGSSTLGAKAATAA